VCGLSGFVAPDHRRADPAIVRRMTATLRHRGPDDEGYYVDGQVALGHRRLQIIDLTTGISRLPTRRARFMPSSTARSTTTAAWRSSSARGAIGSPPAPTLR